MNLHILATIHVDRFSDLNMIAGKNNAIVVEPLSVGSDGTVEVFISGDADVISKLDQSLGRIGHILGSPVVLEVS